MNTYLGIDIGTSSVKSLLIYADGRIIGSAQVGYNIIKTRLNFAEQDINLIWDSARKTISELATKFPEQTAELSGISYSGQMHGLVTVDKNSKPVRDTIIWADQRSSDEIQKIYEMTGKDVFRNTILNSLSTGFLITSLMWVKNHEPGNYRKISRIMLPKDYIRYKMCGEIGTDMSDASGTGIFNTSKRTWAWNLIDRLGIRRNLFPDCHDSAEIAGVLTTSCSNILGLKPGIPIAYGGGDTLMQAIGNFAVEPDCAVANIGTSCQLSVCFSHPEYDHEFRTNTFCHAVKNLWLLMGAHLSGGAALKWLKDNILCMSSFDEMTHLAKNISAGSEGLLFLPYLSGERTPYNDPEAKGIYFGLTLKHDRAHVIRSTMEGIIFGLKTSADIMREIGITWNRMIASGGGAKSPLFRQILADILDSEIITTDGDEQACLGAAITAAVACGEYPDFKSACQNMVRFKSETTAPNKINQRVYTSNYEVFKELYPLNKKLFHKMF